MYTASNGGGQRKEEEANPPFQYFSKSLLQLDLSHNYLRALTSDLVGGLSNLQSLDLTDNDISLVQPGALKSLPNLAHLSLTGKQSTSFLVALRRWMCQS